MGSNKWNNWSGSLAFDPARIAEPESEAELVEIVKSANRDRKKVRVVGAGHSSSPLVLTDDILVSMVNFKGVENPDLEKYQATVLSGMTVKEAGKDLYRYGLAMHNTGDVDVQTLAGAIGTGTHGTGKDLKNLSSMLIGVRMVTGTGEIMEANKEDNPELFKALQVSVGSCGIFIKMRLQLEPAYTLYRKEYCVPIEKCLEKWEQLKNENRNFDFYWYPRSDMAKIRIMNKSEDKMPNIDYGTLELEKEGPSHDILPRTRMLKFDEMEYALPVENAIDCFMEVRERVKAKHRKKVAWRVLVRTIKADDTFIGSMAGRESVTISLHQNVGLGFWDYFQDIEPIFIKYGGRPHWGKKHTKKANELKQMFPQWEKFMEYRKQFDPNEVFLTPYMQELLISEK